VVIGPATVAPKPPFSTKGFAFVYFGVLLDYQKIPKMKLILGWPLFFPFYFGGNFFSGVFPVFPQISMSSTFRK